MRRLLCQVVWWFPATAILAGCHPALQRQESPFHPPKMSNTSVVLEIFRVRIPVDDPRDTNDLWREVDELHFPVELRQRLARNGFRVGVVAGHLPTALSELLQLQENPTSGGSVNELDLAQLATRPQVEKMRSQLPRGKPVKISVSPLYDQLSVLISGDDGQVSGQPYRRAQAHFEVTTFPERDGRVRVVLVPELQHDDPQRQYIGDEATGMIRFEMARPRRTFDELRLTATLAPGSMLIIGGLPNRPASLGQHFFTEDTGQLQQKLLVVRLAQTQRSNLFNLPDVLSLP